MFRKKLVRKRTAAYFHLKSLTIFNNTAIFEGQIDDEGVRALAYRTADAFGLQVLDLLKVGNADPVPESTAAEVTEPGPADFAEQIQALLDDNVHVYAVGETIFLEGSAADEYHRRRACAIAEAYGLPVVDLIRVQERPPEVEPLMSMIWNQTKRRSKPNE